MKIDLNTLKENDLRKFSYADTKDVIAELEKIRLPSLDGIDAIERVEIYYSFVTLIKNRVDNHEFPELSGAGKRFEIKTLHMTLDLLLSSFKFSLDGNKLRKRMLEVDDQVQQTVLDYSAKKEELEKKVESVETEVRNFQKRVDNSEHTILAHVLTLMGVFTAVITIIMSIVITSGSWLNSADISSAIVAFTVPNLVTILAVIVLLTLIFVYQKSFSNDQNKSKGAIGIFVGLFVLIVILCGVMGWVAISCTQPSKATQVLHVISPSEYIVTEEIDCESGEIETYYEFVFEGIKYKFPYNEKYTHDGNLYFCEEHETLE